MANQIPEELKYTIEHEWIKIDGDVATVGITDYAQSALGDIVFVELPEVGTTLEKGVSFGVVESIKSVSDLYSPISGEVLESNENLADSPETINQGAYDAWMIKVKMGNPSEVEELLSPADYQTKCQEEN